MKIELKIDNNQQTCGRRLSVFQLFIVPADPFVITQRSSVFWFCSFCKDSLYSKPFKGPAIGKKSCVPCTFPPTGPQTTAERQENIASFYFTHHSLLCRFYYVFPRSRYRLAIRYIIRDSAVYTSLQVKHQQPPIICSSATFSMPCLFPLLHHKGVTGDLSSRLHKSSIKKNT